MKLMLRLTVLGLIGLTISLTTPGCASGEKETPVAMADLPAAVKATLDRETVGGEVREAEKELKNGKMIYSFDAKIAGKCYDIDIAEDGTLISKKADK
jgi:hypothetical protein